MRKPTWQILALAGAIVFGSLQFANAAGTTTTLVACVKKSGGAMRLVSTTVKCKSSERRVAWNVQGAPGQAGADGERGATGPQGPQGPQGERGATGAAGANGAQGPTGAQGPAGAKGADGADGVNGTNGIFLTPADFVQHGYYAQAGVTLGSFWVDGYNHPAWKIPNSVAEYIWLMTTVPLPAEWKTAASLTITGYYSSSATGGTVYAGTNYQGILAGSALGAGAARSGDFSASPTAAHALMTGSTTVTGLANSDLLEVGFLRVNMPEYDTNNGDVYFYGLRITPNF